MAIAAGRTTRKRVAKPADERRRDLLEAGLRVLTEKGFDRATVDDITMAAGVAKGTFYLYFASKADLVVALRRQVWEQIGAEVSGRAASDEVDWWALFDDWIGVYVAFLLEEGHVHDALWHGAAGVAVPGDADPMKPIARAIAQGAEAGAFSVEDPLFAAAVLFHGIHGAVEAAVARGRVSRARLQRLSRALARRLLQP